MKSVYNFVVTPIGERYNNSKKVEGGNLILNTEIYNHQYVNRIAKVISIPIIGDTDIKPGDEIITHFNVFRRWHNVKGEEKNSRSYFNEDTYFITQDQIFLHKRFARKGDLVDEDYFYDFLSGSDSKLTVCTKNVGGKYEEKTTTFNCSRVGWGYCKFKNAPYKWVSPKGYCFIKPLKKKDQFNIDEERPLIGIVKYSDGTVREGDLVGYKPKTECEFIIDGERLYRVLSNFITIKYEYQGDEEEYNPSWTKSS